MQLPSLETLAGVVNFTTAMANKAIRQPKNPREGVLLARLLCCLVVLMPSGNL